MDKNYIIQSILIPTTKYSVEEASNWIVKNGYILRKIHQTKDYYRFRQHTPKYCKERNCADVKTISIGNDGIKFIVYYCDELINPTPPSYGSEPITDMQRINGGGIYDVGKALIFGRSDFPQDQKALLEKYGSNTITNIKLGRTPLPSFINTALNVLTLGAFQKILQKSPYDKLYHLFSIITLDNGVKILIEKNQAINMKVVSAYNPKNTDYVEVPSIPSGLTFQILMDNTRKSLGNKFFNYDAIKNNCQLFIKTMLSSNGILTKQLQDFIEQNVRELFQDFQGLQKVLKGITSIGTASDVILKGGELSKSKKATPFGRYGGKSRIAKQLISMFPDPNTYDIYVEPFLGAGNVLLRKEPYNHIEIVNDLDKNVYSIFKTLKTDAKYINDNVKRHHVSKEEWLKLNESEDPADILTSMKWSFMNMKKNYGLPNTSNGIPSPIKTNFLQFQDRLKDVIILNTSFENVIKKYDSPKTFFYLDPPYNTKTKNTDYNLPVITQLDIYNAVKNITGKVMISYNDDDEMKELFKNWNVNYITTTYQNNLILKNKTDKSHKILKELVITNY